MFFKRNSKSENDTKETVDVADYRSFRPWLITKCVINNSDGAPFSQVNHLLNNHDHLKVNTKTCLLSTSVQDYRQNSANGEDIVKEYVKFQVFERPNNYYKRIAKVDSTLAKLIEGRDAAFSVHAYWQSRRANGDFFLDQYMHDVYIQSINAVIEMDKLIAGDRFGISAGEEGYPHADDDVYAVMKTEQITI